MFTHRRRNALAALAGLSLATFARADSAPYPAKPVRIIAPFTAGGGTDVLARLVAQTLSQVMNQSFVVENRVGATGSIGAEFVARSAPDGYTLLLGSNAPNALNGLLNPNLSYDPSKDFAPVIQIALVPNVLLVAPSVQAGDVRALIELAKRQPGKMTFGSAGIGSPAHLAGELFRSMAGIDIVHVPYKGGAAVLTDLYGGRVDMLFADQLTAVPQVKGGRLRAFAVTTATRSNTLPDIPTMAEAALPGFDTGLWYGLFAPRSTPASIVGKLNQQLATELAKPQLKAQIAQQGGDVATGSPEELQALVAAEIRKWGALIKERGIRVE
ncbi:MAG: tripartite tricarboxylate transporter substrate binding protein [Lautropia sp.]